MSSGSAALASAKNRRSAGNIVKLAPNDNTKSCSVNSENKNGSGRQVLSPLQIINMHEFRLCKLEKEHSAFGESLVSLSNNQLDNSRVMSKSSPIISTNSSTSNEEVTQLRERVALLEEMFEHLKEDIFRVQTFAMETNITLMRVQKNIATNDNSQENDNSEENDNSNEVNECNQDFMSSTFNEKVFNIEELKKLSR